MKNKIIVLTGPPGIGKSTTAIQLGQRLIKCAYIEGDLISHLPISGREKPWESKEANNLVWKNIKDLSMNFINSGYDVIIDWIVFWDDINEHLLNWIEDDIEFRYVVLWANEDIHINRDKQRNEDIQMGERVTIVRNDFIKNNIPVRYYLDNTNAKVNDIVETILNDNNFIIEIK